MKYIHFATTAIRVRYKDNELRIAYKKEPLERLSQQGILVINGLLIESTYDAVTKEVVVTNLEEYVNTKGMLVCGFIDMNYPVEQHPLTYSSLDNTNGNFTLTLPSSVPVSPINKKIVVYAGVMFYGGDLQMSLTGNDLEINREVSQFTAKVMNTLNDLKVVGDPDHTVLEKRLMKSNTTFLLVKGSEVPTTHVRLESDVPGSFRYWGKKKDPVLVDNLGRIVQYRQEKNDDNITIIPYTLPLRKEYLSSYKYIRNNPMYHALEVNDVDYAVYILDD